MKKFWLVFIVASSLFAQYNKNDYELVKTTFYRSFDKTVIEKYLDSAASDSVNAALLSISQSKDTTWVKEIIKLNFDQFGDYICFALAELGDSYQSAYFLYNKIFSTDSKNYLKECYEALGSTADSATIELLITNISKVDKEKLSGLPYALNNFNSRYPLPQKDMFIKYLVSEIERVDQNLDRKFDALFVLYRLGGSKDTSDALTNISIQKEERYNPLKYYALGNFRKVSFFPNDESLFDELLNDKDSRIRTEAARTLCFYDFKNFDDIEKYISLLADSNPNVSRQAAISVVNIKVEGELKEKLYDKIYNLINASDLTENTKGELFVNYCKYKNEEYPNLIEKFDGKIKKDFIYNVLSDLTTFPQRNFEYIKNNIKDTTEVDFLNISQALIPLQDSLADNAEFKNLILSILNSSSPLGISLIADNLDSLLIRKNINAIQQIVIEQVFKYYNNMNYLESFKSLYNLSKKVSHDFANEILSIYKNSQLNQLKTFAKRNLEEKIIPEETKDIGFDKLWSFAFKYTGAKVSTNKGNFTIEFRSQFAPVSVANFCFLVSQNYFDDCVFHRVVPNFVIQTGDPSSTGWGGPGYEIVSEFSPTPFDEAYVGMASSGKDTEGSQWFVMHSSYPHLNGRYTNFGKVIKGMDIVNIIDQNDKIIDIELID